MTTNPSMSKCLVFMNALSILCLCEAGVINVALNKPAKMSSRHGRETLPAGGAVDGKITTRFPNLMHTAEYQSYAWWSVDLQTQVQDAVVKIYFRTDYKKRRNGVRLYTSRMPFSSYPDGHLCHRFTGTNIPDVVSVNCTGTWRYLMVYTDTRTEKRGIVLDLGEVEVLGCDGTYGLTCDNNCRSRQCAVRPTACDRYTGACPAGGCKAGWMGTDCTQECDGSYGQNCSKSCRFRQCAVTPTTCDRFTGACPAGGCKAGWMGIDCAQECDGGYGQNCNRSCRFRQCTVTPTTCDRFTGACPAGGCKVGWLGIDCTQECDGSYGQNCSKSCRFRQCAVTPTTCDRFTGACPAGGCKAGWMGIDCTQGCKNRTFGISCLGTCGRCKSSCDVVDGHCLGGCQAGYSGDQCLLMITFGDSDASLPYVRGTLIGVVVTVVVIGGILLCLFRHGRIMCRASTRSEDAERPVRMCDVTAPPCYKEL